VRCKEYNKDFGSGVGSQHIHCYQSFLELQEEPHKQSPIFQMLLPKKRGIFMKPSSIYSSQGKDN
jgi:hypothetical protein